MYSSLPSLIADYSPNHNLLTQLQNFFREDKDLRSHTETSPICSAFSSLVVRLFGKILGFGFFSFFAEIRFFIAKKLGILQNMQDQAEYNYKNWTACFDTMLHLRKEKAHQISL